MCTTVIPLPIPISCSGPQSNKYWHFTSYKSPKPSVLKLSFVDPQSFYYTNMSLKLYQHWV